MLHYTFTGTFTSRCICLKIPWNHASLAINMPHCYTAWPAQHFPQRLPASAQLGACAQVSVLNCHGSVTAAQLGTTLHLSTLQRSGMSHSPLQVPTDYFLLVLGKHKKYSSCLWPDSSLTLDEAEAAMLGEQC